MIKRLLCNHTWERLGRYAFHLHYGCDRCGATRKIFEGDLATWRFKRKAKGETFK